MNETLRSRTRVLVTGLGAVTPLGHTVAEFWDGLIAGRSGVGPLTLADPAQFPCKVAAEVKNWDPFQFIERKAARRMARFAQFMVAAAGQAIADARLELDAENRDRIAVFIGNGGGGYPDIQEAVNTLTSRGGMKISAPSWRHMSVNTVRSRAFAITPPPTRPRARARKGSGA